MSDAQRRHHERAAGEERAAVTTRAARGDGRLVRQADALALIQSMCEGLVAATPHIRLAWAWFGHPDTREIRPMVAAGPAKAYADRAGDRAQRC